MLSTTVCPSSVTTRLSVLMFASAVLSVDKYAATVSYHVSVTFPVPGSYLRQESSTTGAANKNIAIRLENVSTGISPAVVNPPQVALSQSRGKGVWRARPSVVRRSLKVDDAACVQRRGGNTPPSRVH